MGLRGKALLESAAPAARPEALIADGRWNSEGLQRGQMA